MGSVLQVLLLLGLSACGQKKTDLKVDDFEKGISQPQTQLLDVRTLEEYQQSHMAHALLADWYNPGEFEERVKHLDKQKPLYVYCATGLRSAAAVKKLHKSGFTSVYNLDGGIIAWKAANKPVESGSPIKQLSRAEYDKIITSSPVVLVDFGAPWCPPCKKMEPVLEQLKKDLPTQFMMAQVDAGVHISIMQEMKVEKLPVFIVYKNGKEVWRNAGITSLEDLKKAIL